MADLLTIYLVSAFLTGGAFIALLTIIAERFGSRLGGFIAALPSTIVVALIFIYLSQSQQFAISAMTSMPMTLGINTLFLVVFYYLSARGFAVGITGAYLVWAVMASVAVVSGIRDIWVSIAIYAVFFAISYYLLMVREQARHLKGARIHYTGLQVLFRAVAGGLVISGAVAASELLGPLVGGAVSMLPIVFGSTLAITYRSMGIQYSRAISRSFIPGTVSTVVYVAAAAYLFGQLGIWLGTVSSYAISVLSAYALYLWAYRNSPSLGS